MEVTAQCIDTGQVIVRITAEMSIYNWQRVIVELADSTYGTAESGFRHAIMRALQQITERSVFTHKEEPNGPR